MVLKLVGVQALKHKAADGRTKIYYRDRKSGLALGTSDNEQAVLDKHAALSEGRKGPAARTRAAGSYAAAIQAYRESPEFAALAPRTAELWRAALKRLETIWGHFPPEHISRYVVSTAKSGLIRKHGPTGAKNLYVAARATWGWFLAAGLTTAENPFSKPGKFETREQRIDRREKKREAIWRIDQIRQILDSTREVNAGGNPAFLRDGAVTKNRTLPDDVRLALLLGFFTCQRQTDILNMRADQLERRGEKIWVRVTQHKTGVTVRLPLHDLLRAEIDRQGIEPGSDRLLVRSPVNNARFRREGFYKRFELWTRGAGTNLTFQALRRSGMVALAELGNTIPQIAAVSGHSIAQTSAILEEYISRTEDMAEAAIDAWNRSTQPPPQLPQPPKRPTRQPKLRR